MKKLTFTFMIFSIGLLAACGSAGLEKASNNESQKTGGSVQQVGNESVAANQNKAVSNTNEGAKADANKSKDAEPGKAAATDRKSVSGAEVTGTFRDYFTSGQSGKKDDTYNEIKIQALGDGKLKVDFYLVYPTGEGETASANLGRAQGEALIDGDTAVYTTKENGGTCEIKIKFVKPGVINVTQEQTVSGCGFGLNVSAQGTYKKFSSKKPKFIPLEQ